MRLRTFLVMVVALVLAPVVATTTEASAADKCSVRCKDVTVPVPTGVKVTSNNVRLLVPYGYSSSTDRYPVIYMLCGAGGNQIEWTYSSNFTAFTADMKAIFVLPDCGGAAGAPGWYSDWYNGAWQWETYYLDVLVPWIDAHYRTIPSARGIAGLSMGGYGALALTARHPGVFKAAASFGGFPQTQYTGVSMVNLGIIPPGVWGNEKSQQAVWTAHNPTALVQSLRGVSLYLACGTGGSQSDAAREENLVAQDHVPFVNALNSAGIPFHNGFFQGGEHTWPYFSAEASWALPQMLADLTNAGAS